jgi:hypothetical protein
MIPSAIKNLPKGGSSKGRVSLHSVETGKRLCQNAQDIKFLTYNTWRTRYVA